MPITQDRMKALLDAAIEAQEQLQTLSALHSALEEKLSAGKWSVERVLNVLFRRIELAQPKSPGLVVVAHELRHWELTHQRNRRNKSKQARRRGAESLAPFDVDALLMQAEAQVVTEIAPDDELLPMDSERRAQIESQAKAILALEDDEPKDSPK